MKDKLVTSFKYILGDRRLMTAVIFLVLISVAELIYIAFTLRPSELQLVNRYSAYGEVHLYRNHWYYLLVFIGFVLINAIFSVAMAIKLYSTHSKPAALFCVVIGIVVAIIAWFTAASIINIWSPVQ